MKCSLTKEKQEISPSIMLNCFLHSLAILRWCISYLTNSMTKMPDKTARERKVNLTHIWLTVLQWYFQGHTVVEGQICLLSADSLAPGLNHWPSLLSGLCLLLSYVNIIFRKDSWSLWSVSCDSLLLWCLKRCITSSLKTGLPFSFLFSFFFWVNNSC